MKKQITHKARTFGLKLMGILIIMLFISIQSFGQLYEDFNYTVGQNIGGNAATTGGPVNNWYTHNNTKVGSVDVTSGSLSYSGLQTSTGNKIRLPGDNTNVPRDINRGFTAISTSVAYYSALINIVDNTQLSTTGDYFMHFGTTSGIANTVFGGRLGAKSVSSGTKFRFVIQNTSSGTPTFTEFATDMNFGTTYLVVVKYDKSTSPTTAYLWVNPTNLGGTEPTGFVQNNSGTATYASFASICLRNSSGTPKADIDEIRVGTTWSSVTPASSVTTPTLVADATNNNVDNNIDITFTDDAAWRAAITAVKIGGTSLTPTTDYVITAGNIQLIPSGGNSLLTTAGSKSITVVATGYTDAAVTQVINAGAPTTNSTASINSPLALNSTATITCTAKDQYNNLVAGYTFKYDATLTDNNSATDEIYTLDGSPITLTTNDINVVATTDANGVATFTATLPATVDGNDGISIQVQLNDGTTNIGTAFSFSQLASQTITFGALSPVTYGDANFELVATATSGLTVSFASSNTSVATVSGTTVTIVGIGSTNITASQDGNASFNPAANVVQELVVNPKTLTLQDAAAQNKVYNGTKAAIITGTLTGIIGTDTVTLVGTGVFADSNVAVGISVSSNCTLAGAQASKYTLTQPLGLTANITQASQTIIFAAIPVKATTDADFNPGATSATSAVNPITYTSSNLSVATIVSGMIHIVGAGTSTITASQAGNINYTVAADVQQTLTVTTGPIIAWQFGSPAAAGTEVTYNATTNNTNLNISILSRGSGILPTALSRGFSANDWNVGATKATAVSTNEYYQFVINPKATYTVSLSTLNATLRRTSTAPIAYIWKYSLDGTTFTEIGTDSISFTSTADGVPQAQIDLSGIAVLQNVTSATTITFRLYAWGGSSLTSTFAFARYPSGNTTNCLAIGGTVSAVSDTIPTIAIPSPTSLSGFFTNQGTPSGSQTFTISGTNLTNDLVITAPANYEVRENGIGSFGTSVIFSPFANSGNNPPNPGGSPVTNPVPTGSVSSKIIEVRIAASAGVGTLSGNVICSSLNATSQNVALSGIVVMAEPSNHATSFVATAASQTQIDLTFSAASTITNAAGYLILQKTGSAPTGAPLDANGYTVGNPIGDATVAANITNLADTSKAITGLAAGTHYYFTIFPYNWDGVNALTYNYKTDMLVPVTDATTFIALDASSEVSGPALVSQPDPVLVSSLVTSDTTAIHVFNMDIYDYSGDAQPTKITQVTIKAGAANTANWANTIQGIKLSIDGGATYVTTGTPVITASSIVIPIVSGNLIVLDNDALTLSLYVYLKTSGLIDNKILEFKVDNTASSHGFIADATGSTFLPTFTTAPVSHQMLIDVVATKLNFVQQPSNVGTSVNITPSVTISATDANGNRDLDYATNVNVMAIGATLNAAPVSVTPINGLATFSTLSFSSAATAVTLNAISGSLNGATSISFDVLLLPNPGEIVINQFSPDYSGSSNEYIELVNKTDKSFDLSMFKIEYKSASGGSGSAGGTLSGTLAPYQYWLLSPDATITVGQTTSLARDGAITAGFAFPSGQLALRLVNSPNTIIDGLAYGTITSNVLGEGAAASAPPADGGLVRVSDGADNNVNATDFTTITQANIYLRNHNSYNISNTYTLPSTTYTADVVISGTAPNVTLSGNTTIAGKLTILTGNLTVASNQNLTVNGTLTNNAGITGLVIKSDGAGTASLKHYTAGVNATVERFIPQNLADEFHMLASPVSGQTIAPNFNEPESFFVWNEPTGAWIELADTTNFAAANFGSSTNFIPAKGYAVSYPSQTKKDFAGVLNEGNVTIPLTVTTGTYSGWNFVANPFPSAIDWSVAAGFTRNMLMLDGAENAMWIWDATAGQYGSCLSNGISNLPSVTKDIAMGQGFWVLANTAGTFGINNTARVHSTQNFLKSSTTEEMLRLAVSGNANSYHDGIVVRFGSTSDQSGAPKMFSLEASAPSLYSTKLNKNWSINSLTTIAQHPVVPVSFKAGANGNYTITASELNSFVTTTYVYLKDLKTNTITNLNQNPNYTFAATTNDNADRFQLIFAASPLGILDNQIQNTSIFSNNNNIYINSNEVVKQISIYNTLGQLVKTIDSNNGTIIVNMNGNVNGYYIVRVITNKNVYSEKVLIK